MHCSNCFSLLRNFEDCIIDQVKSLCGSGVSDDVRAYIRKVIKFVDCGVPAAEELSKYFDPLHLGPSI